MAGLIQPPFISDIQAADLVLCNRMNDMGDDGQAADVGGQANIVAPCRGRVLHVMGACETGLSAGTKFLVHRLPAAVSTANQDAVAANDEGAGWIEKFAESDNIYFEKGDVIQVQSDGGSAATGFGYIQVIFRPSVDQDLPIGAFVICGENVDGTAAYDQDWPSVGDVEILELITFNNFFTTASWVLTAKKNGSSPVVAVTGTNGAAAAVLSGRVTDADRFLSKEDHIRMDGPGVVGAGGKHPYALICRRL